tara:strand:+ start:494 stop:1090 length:597 start_codon:yes stop_codon:yes gene_type:complete
MDYEENELQNLAQIIKDGFARRKEVAIGRKYRPHSKYQDMEVWLKIARLCKELNAAPDDFLDAAFTFAIKPEGAPFPPMLSGKAMRSWYEQYSIEFPKENSGKDINTKLEVLVDQEIRCALNICIRRESRLGKSFRETLLDTLVKFSPYIRLLLLKNEAEAWVRYGEEVKRSIYVRPGLDKILEKKGLEIRKLYDAVI